MINKSLKWYDILNTKQEFFTPTIDFTKNGIVFVSNLQTLRVGCTEIITVMIIFVLLIIALIFMRLFYFMENPLKSIFCNIIYSIYNINLHSKITNPGSSSNPTSRSDQDPSGPDKDPKNDGLLTAIAATISNNRLLIGSLFIISIAGGVYYVITCNPALITEVCETIKNLVSSTKDTEIITNMDLLYRGIDLEINLMDELRDSALTVQELFKILLKYPEDTEQMLEILTLISLESFGPTELEALDSKYVNILRELLIAIQDKRNK